MKFQPTETAETPAYGPGRPAPNERSKANGPTRPKFLNEIREHDVIFSLAGLGTLFLALAAIIGVPVDTAAALDFFLVVIGLGVHSSIGTLLGDLVCVKGFSAMFKSAIERLGDIARGTMGAVLPLAALFWYAVAVGYTTIAPWLVGVAIASLVTGFFFEWRAASSHGLQTRADPASAP